MPVVSDTAFFRRPTVAIAAIGLTGIAGFAAGLGLAFDLGTVYRALPLVLMGGFIALGIALAVTRANCAPTLKTGLVFSTGAGLIFAFVLGAKWYGAVSSDVLLGGILPTLDAESYFQGAVHFLDQGRLTAWSTRRPLMTMQLAGLLGLTGGSFHLALAVLAALMAAGVVVVAATLARAYGTAAACVGVALLLPFLLPTVGTTMSENIGFTLGAAGFALMAFAASDQSSTGRGLVIFACGLALCSLALSARAGAMFVMPLMVLYAGWRFRGAKRFAPGPAAMAAIAVASAMALNFAAIRFLGAEGDTGFSNFSYTLYGLAKRGADWLQAYRDVPSLRELATDVQAREIYRLAIAHMVAHPIDLLVGIAHRYNDFFINTRWFQFDGLGGTRVLFAVFALAGTVAIWRARREAMAAFILTGVVGIWLSVPFIGDGGTRVHAATVGFTATLVAAGAAFFFRRLAGTTATITVPSVTVPASAGVLGVVVLACVGAALMTGHRNDSAAVRPSPPCTADTIPLALMTIPDAAIDITNRNVPRRSLHTTVAQLVAARQWPFGDDAILRLPLPARVGLAQAPVTPQVFTVVSEVGVALPPRFTTCVRKNRRLIQLDRITPAR